MKKRLLSVFLCLCLLIPSALTGITAAADDTQSEYVMFEVPFSLKGEKTANQLNEDLFAGSASFDAVDLTKLGSGYDNLALEMDLKVEGDETESKELLDLLCGDEATRMAGIAGQFEFSSDGKWDKNEADIYSYQIQWKRNGWTRFRFMLKDLTTSAGTFDKTHWNYMRWHWQPKVESVIGQSVNINICHVRIVDTTKTDKATEAEQQIGNDPTDPEGYVLLDVSDYCVNTRAIMANGSDLMVKARTFTDPINLQSYIDAGCDIGFSFDVYIDGDEEACKYVAAGNLNGQIELTSSGKWDVEEANAGIGNLNFKYGRWNRTVIPLSAFNQGSFRKNNFNFLRIYIQSSNSKYDGQSIQIGICNLQIVDMNKLAPSVEERPLGDGSFTAADPEYFEVKPAEGYDNSEIMVAGYNARDYVKNVMKEDPDKVTDWAPIIQSLANGMAKVGGGVVYLPAGRYPCTSNILLPSSVTLYGDWVNPDEHPELIGTVLEVYYGKDNNDAAGFIGMGHSSKVQNLAFWYPEQSNPGDVIPYAPTITTGQYCRVDNVTLVNSYDGIAQRSTANCPNASNIYGTPLNVGADIGTVVDLCRLYQVHFAASYWENSGVANAPTSAEAKAQLEKHLRERATGIIYRRVDWSYVNFSHVKGYNIGMAMLESTYYNTSGNLTASYINGQIYGNLFEDCAIALYCEGTTDHGEAIVDTEIRGCDYGLWFNSVNAEKTQNIQFSNCKIDATVATVYQSGVGSATVALEGCTLSGAPVQLAQGILSSTNTTYTMDAPHVVIEAGATSATLAGNKDKDGKPIVVQNGPQVPLTRDDNTVETMEYVTATEEEATTQVKKPTGTTVKVAEGLDNTGKTDVTAALQAQLDSLKTSGGLLYLPAGHYRLDGSITIPSGVELKGALAVGRVPFNVGTILDVYGGKDDENASATVILKEKSGIRGITFNWPEQYADGKFHTYPYAMQGQGSDIYVIHTSLRNAWKGLDLFSYRCDNHYVEYLSGTSLCGGIHVGGGSQNGKLIDCHFNYNAMHNPDSYGWGAVPNGLKKTDWEDIFQNQIQHNAVAYRFGDVKDELVFGCMTYSGKAGLQFIEENGKAASVRVFCQSIDYGNIAIDVQAIDKLDLISIQTTSFDQLPTEGNLALKDDGYDIRLGEKVTTTVNARAYTMWGTAVTNAIDVENGTLNMFGVVSHRTHAPLVKISAKGQLNAVSWLVKESDGDVTQVVEPGSVANAGNVSMKVGVVYYDMTDADKLGKYEGVITRLTRWDVPDDTKAFGENSKVLFSEGFTDYTKLGDKDKVFKQKNTTGMTSGSVARSGRMTLTVVAQESGALILTDVMEIPQGKSDSLYRLESRVQFPSMRAGSSITMSAYNNESDILNLAVFNADGTVVTQGKKSVGTFETNKWYRLAIELDLRDTANKTMQVYLYDDEYKLVGHSDVIALPSWFQGEYELQRLQWGVENANLSSDAAEVDETIAILDYVLASYSTETTFGTLGDVDGDGKITSTDARLALQCYAGKISADKLNTAVGDVDGDGKITSTDARLILQRYVGKISKFPVE